MSVMRLRDFLSALEERGRGEEADDYRNKFLELFSLVLSEDEVLDLPFDDLCLATSLLKMLTQKSGLEARVSELKIEGANVTYGEHYLKKKGLL